jgi:hypothetical protein
LLLVILLINVFLSHSLAYYTKKEEPPACFSYR